jgi:hypothetical protein
MEFWLNVPIHNILVLSQACRVRRPRRESSNVVPIVNRHFQIHNNHVPHFLSTRKNTWHLSLLWFISTPTLPLELLLPVLSLFLFILKFTWKGKKEENASGQFGNHSGMGSFYWQRWIVQNPSRWDCQVFDMVSRLSAAIMSIIAATDHDKPPSMRLGPVYLTGVGGARIFFALGVGLF